MPVCKKCGRFSNVLTVDVCEHCGAKDWMEESLHDRTMREHGERYARMTPAQRAASQPKKRTDDGTSWGCAFGLIVLAFVGVAAYNYLTTSDGESLSSQYGIPKERVYVQPKPHGCAYNDAPLGDKHCHYDKHIIVYSQDGRVIEKDGSRATECPFCQVWSVVETWEKIEK